MTTRHVIVERRARGWYVVLRPHDPLTPVARIVGPPRTRGRRWVVETEGAWRAAGVRARVDYPTLTAARADLTRLAGVMAAQRGDEVPCRYEWRPEGAYELSAGIGPPVDVSGPVVVCGVHYSTAPDAVWELETVIHVEAIRHPCNEHTRCEA